MTPISPKAPEPTKEVADADDFVMSHDLRCDPKTPRGFRASVVDETVLRIAERIANIESDIASTKSLTRGRLENIERAVDVIAKRGASLENRLAEAQSLSGISGSYSGASAVLSPEVEKIFANADFRMRGSASPDGMLHIEYVREALAGSMVSVEALVRKARLETSPEAPPAPPEDVVEAPMEAGRREGLRSVDLDDVEESGCSLERLREEHESLVTSLRYADEIREIDPQPEAKLRFLSLSFDQAFGDRSTVVSVDARLQDEGREEIVVVVKDEFDSAISNCIHASTVAISRIEQHLRLKAREVAARQSFEDCEDD